MSVCHGTFDLVIGQKKGTCKNDDVFRKSGSYRGRFMISVQWFESSLG